MNMFNDKSQLLSCSKRSKNNSLLTLRHGIHGSLDTLTHQRPKMPSKLQVAISMEEHSPIELSIYTTTSYIHTTMLSAIKIDLLNSSTNMNMNMRTIFKRCNNNLLISELGETGFSDTSKKVRGRKLES